MSGPRRPMTKGAGRVKAPRKHVQPLDDTLQRVEEAVAQIQQHQASQLSFEAVYRNSYNLVLHKQGHTLYNAVSTLIINHLESEARNKIVPVFPPSVAVSVASGSGTQSGGQQAAASNMAQAEAGQLFLDRVKEVWDDHSACMGKLKDVFKYMDKVYTGSSSLPSTWDLGLSLFFHHVILFSTSGPRPKPPPPSRAGSRAQPPTISPVADPTTIASHLINTLLSVIRIEREGEVVSRHSIADVVAILSTLTDEGPIPLPVTASQGTGSGTPVLGVGSGGGSGRGAAVMGEQGLIGQSPYRTAFEKAFLKQSEEFYQRESKQLLVENDCPTFLKKINRRLEEERTRAQTYLAPSTEPLLVNLLERTLISAHLTAILDHPASGLSTLIQDSRLDDLRLLYTLFGRVGTGHAALQTAVSKWIIEIGGKVNEGLLVVLERGDDEGAADPKGKGKAREDAAGDTDMKPDISAVKKKVEAPGNAKTKAALAWVQNVLDLKDKFDAILNKAFSGDKAFEKSINDAFSVFVNQNTKSPEYISLFIDENLKKGLKGKTEVEVDDVLNKTIALFRFLIEKDHFEKYYNSHLAKRLISSRSVSDDAERNMLAKFKVEAGAAFTKSAEGMMKDIKTSEDALAEYKRYQDRTPAVKAPFSMEPIVCGQNFWPFSNKDQICNLPPVLLDGVKAYEAFYNVKHSGRVLTFRPELGSVDVKTKFKARTHELSVSTHCMCVLALFEGLGDDESLSYQDIASSTNMAAADLKRTLQSLACAKFKVLTKVPKGRDVDDTDSFLFNSAFTAPLAKIKIQTVASKVESADERRETEEKVEEMRNTQCDACIVRVMKDRKVLQHTDLVNEVIRQLSSRFLPKPAMIKKAIERMIEKEYLERDENDRRTLRYMA
ncbi:Cullin-domain-containing protein [Leucosporidium creatinivorum]|uniref:Cullin-domain-containing protein n=1 Tax=Leucosporidium creatinivorum TaxID=106004 RepID=A0A1Y2FXV0_9BASI|nr:Cullin-domain-containing protein [Leucosporidium creatinivorum]